MVVAKFLLWSMLIGILGRYLEVTWDKFLFWVIVLNVWALTKINMIQVIDHVIQMNKESKNTNE